MDQPPSNESNEFNLTGRNSNSPKGNYIRFQVDKYNSTLVLVIYEHAYPTNARNYYSKFVNKNRTQEQQVDAMISLMIRKRMEAKVMILYQNHKRGTGPVSDLPNNQELVRVHHGREIDFGFSYLDDDSRRYLVSRLQPLQH